MRIIFAAALVAGAGSVSADIVAPSAVSYEDGAIAMSLTGGAGDPASGREIMNKGAGNCIACHMVTDLAEFPFHGEIGPMLDGVADRWSEGELRGIVANAKIMFEGTMMPAFYKTEGFIRPGDAYTGKAAEGALEPLLTAEQVEDVVAYLLTLTEQ